MNSIKFVVNGNEILRFKISNNEFLNLRDSVYIYGEEYLIISTWCDEGCYIMNLRNKDVLEKLKRSI